MSCQVCLCPVIGNVIRRYTYSSRGCNCTGQSRAIAYRRSEENSGGAMALLHPHRSDRYEGKRTYTSDRLRKILKR
ncbi:hypothetical protein [Nostoc sp.]|uniref:hypothetical protein n=1 Tax=Nostoc sp. TaxID=1180 RepID=UPI002FFB5EA1